jgi:hypothetical protein
MLLSFVIALEVIGNILKSLKTRRSKTEKERRRGKVREEYE